MCKLTGSYSSYKSFLRLCLILPALLIVNTGKAELIADSAEVLDGFGLSLTMGDFTNDGLHDLAIGVPYEDIEAFGQGDQGAVNVFYANKLNENNEQLDGNHPGFSTPSANSALGYATAAADFNGDGFDDLAVGLPFAAVSGRAAAGAVYVYYGHTSGNGLKGSKDRFWQGMTPANAEAIQGIAEDGDNWGAQLATGLFNNDEFYDLAIAAPGEEIDGRQAAGAVSILYGSASGLTTVNNQLWHQNVASMEGTAESHDHFGSALASGDFDGNGRDDLAIGVPGENIGASLSAGAVNVVYGYDSGLAVLNDQLWHQNSDSIKGLAETDDEFGRALAAGDFDNNGKDDLAIGVPGENAKTGMINIIYGLDGGLSSLNDEIWSQGSDQIAGQPEIGDSYGEALAAGFFNQDNFADLAVGVPGEAIGQKEGAHGAVNIMYGFNSGLTEKGNRVFTQDTPGIPETAEGVDYFGSTLSTGDLNGDGLDELAIGVPGENSMGQYWSGAVQVLTGDNVGLTGSFVYLYQK